jgi:hypothetical protein
MPARPVGSISGNIPRKKELTPLRTQYYCWKASANTGPTQIAEELSIPRSTVQETLYHDGTSAPHSGAPKKLLKHDKHRILRAFRKEPQITYARLIRELTLAVCTTPSTDYSRTTI